VLFPSCCVHVTFIVKRFDAACYHITVKLAASTFFPQYRQTGCCHVLPCYRQTSCYHVFPTIQSNKLLPRVSHNTVKQVATTCFPQYRQTSCCHVLPYYRQTSGYHVFPTIPSKKLLPRVTILSANKLLARISKSLVRRTSCYHVFPNLCRSNILRDCYWCLTTSMVIR